MLGWDWGISVFKGLNNSVCTVVPLIRAHSKMCSYIGGFFSSQWMDGWMDGCFYFRHKVHIKLYKQSKRHYKYIKVGFKVHVEVYSTLFQCLKRFTTVPFPVCDWGNLFRIIYYVNLGKIVVICA